MASIMKSATTGRIAARKAPVVAAPAVDARFKVWQPVNNK